VAGSRLLQRVAEGKAWTGPQPCSENQLATRRSVAETVIAFSARCGSQ
jgi:hypothetical protein